MKKVLIIIAVILVIMVGTAYGALYYIDSKIYVAHKNSSDHNTTKSSSSLLSLISSVLNQGGSESILLSGIDARNKDTSSRTDSIIMTTIDRSNKSIKLTSFMRDLYVSVPGHTDKYKINDAYFFGGADLLMQTLNQNFNTNLQYYVIIDFSAFQALVDKFNGIDINVKPDEVNEMNKYIKEENWHDPIFVTKSGMQHLNGQQVLAYCRIRHVGNNDFERTERQRRVLTLLVQKARKESLFALPSLISTILPYVKTNIPSPKLLALGISLLKYSSTPVTTLRIPADGMYSNQAINGQDVLIPDLQRNSDLLEKFLTSAPASALVSKNQSKSNANAVNNKNNTKETASIADKIDNSSGIPSVSTSSAQSSTAANTSVKKSKITVCLLNSTGKAGLAAEYKTRIEALGYDVTQTGNYNYGKYNTTLINDYSKNGYGDVIIKDLKFGNLVEKDKIKPLADIVIILGQDSTR